MNICTSCYCITYFVFPVFYLLNDYSPFHLICIVIDCSSIILFLPRSLVRKRFWRLQNISKVKRVEIYKRDGENFVIKNLSPETYDINSPITVEKNHLKKIIRN